MLIIYYLLPPAVACRSVLQKHDAGHFYFIHLYHLFIVYLSSIYHLVPAAAWCRPLLYVLLRSIVLWYIYYSASSAATCMKRHAATCCLPLLFVIYLPLSIIDYLFIHLFITTSIIHYVSLYIQHAQGILRHHNTGQYYFSHFYYYYLY
jgi:hypothetical protein